jgi:hypothetical protein
MILAAIQIKFNKEDPISINLDSEITHQKPMLFIKRLHH